MAHLFKGMLLVAIFVRNGHIALVTSTAGVTRNKRAFFISRFSLQR